MVYDILIVGAGWTSTFLIPLLRERKIKFAATTRSGRDSTIKWTYSPDCPRDYFSALPDAHTVLITFPLLGCSQADQFITSFRATHQVRAQFIQLGSSGIWQIPQPELWITRHSRYDVSDSRAQAEDTLMGHGGVVLNLSGLWGGERQPRNFVSRLFRSKTDVMAKTSLHMVHGRDVARGIVAVMEAWPGASRWLVTDGFVYDWWALLAGWGDSSSSSSPGHSQSSSKSVERDGKSGSDSSKFVKEDDRPDPVQEKQTTDETNDSMTRIDSDAHGKVLTWVRECMREENVRALPRDMQLLGRCYDSREFWDTFHLTPVRARI